MAPFLRLRQVCLERHGARDGGAPGYMVIMDCDDQARWQARAESLSVRVANVIRHDNYFGVQLHPKDSGAAMLEFNSTAGGADPMGPYAPAGPNWQAAICNSVTRALTAVEIESPEPAGIAARWGAILDRPVQELGGGKSRIALDTGAIHFLPGSGPEAVFAGVELEASKSTTVDVCGLRFRLRASDAAP